MPTYQYACTECDHRFEQVQGFADDSLTECPRCPGRLRKLFNAVGVVFKGSGFYRNDSREAAGANGSGAAATPPGGAGEKAGPSEKPAEKKPAEKKPAAGTGEKSSAPAKAGGSAAAG